MTWMEQTENMHVCAVPVATIWTSPEAVRYPMDEPGIGAPQHMNDWLAAMTQEDRFALCKEGRVQSQLLYGEPVIVDEIRDGWAKVIAVWQRSPKDERGYPGWVPAVQLKESEPLDDPVGVVRVDIPKCQVWHTDGTPDDFVIPFNAVLPLLSAEDGWTEVAAPDGKRLLRKEDVCTASSVHHFPEKSPAEACERAFEFLDLPYFWGGMSSYGYDCSGLTYNMFKSCGLSIARDAGDQAAEGKPVLLDDPDSWQRGDLLFFKGEESDSITHVGFYCGGGLMIHATSTKRGAVELDVLKDTAYADRLCAVRRYT